MLQGILHRVSVAALLVAGALAASVQPSFAYGTSPGQGRLLAANYGSAALPPNLGQLVCPEAPGRDGIPIHFETEIGGPVLPEDFIVRGENGDVRPVLCATFDPSDDVGDRRSILLVGEFGDADDQPVSVEVIGDIWSLDSTLSYRGAYAAMIPLEAPPALILAEVVPPAEWDLDNPGTPIPWGGGTGCPSEGTQQVLRVVWGGGVRAVGGAEVTEAEWRRYVVAVRRDDGRVAFVRPFAVGDLNDGDNNHELCLNVQGEPLAVRIPEGLMEDPNGDVNEASRIRVSRSRAADSCLAEAYPISASLDPGSTNTGLYETVTPFEHADVERTHVYRADFGGSLTSPVDNAVRVREYDGIHEAPYNIVTRDRDELFVYGGTQGEREEAEGPYVVKLDATTREVVWRTDLRDTKARGEFLWPGLVTVHGNGDLYAIYGTRLARLDPRDGTVKLEIQLPTPAGAVPEDINYNGFTVLESGVIVTKSFGRPAGCTDQGLDAFQNCVSEDNPLPPSVVVSVDPDSLDVLDTYQLEEGAGGRLTRAVFEGREYVYVPGDTTIVRFEVDDAGALSLDEGWSVADYLDEGQTPASAPVAMGDWIVFQTNASSSSSPLSVLAVAQADASVRLETKPFGQGFPPVSFIPSALTVDPDNLRIYPMDTGRGKIASIELVDGERLETRWVVDQVTLNHTSLVGPADARVFVATDAPDLLRAILGQAEGYEEQVVWRSAETGEELARSELLSPMLPGDPLAPGFFGVWFYPSADSTLIELEVEGPELAACREEQADDGV